MSNQAQVAQRILVRVERFWSSLAESILLLIHLLPLLENEIATAPRRVHGVSLTSITIYAVQLWRRRSSENGTFYAFFILTFRMFIEQAVGCLKRLIKSTIVQERRRFATICRNRIELPLLHLLWTRLRLWFAPKLLLSAFTRYHGRVSSRAQMVIVIRRHFLNISTEFRVTVNRRLSFVCRRPFLGSRTEFIPPHRKARLVRWRTQRRYRWGVQIEIVRTRLTPNHRWIDTGRARVSVLMLMIRRKWWANVWQLGIWRREVFGRLQFSATDRKARCKWLQGYVEMQNCKITYDQHFTSSWEISCISQSQKIFNLKIA